MFMHNGQIGDYEVSLARFGIDDRPVLLQRALK